MRVRRALHTVQQSSVFIEHGAGYQFVRLTSYSSRAYLIEYIAEHRHTVHSISYNSRVHSKYDPIIPQR